MASQMLASRTSDVVRGACCSLQDMSARTRRVYLLMAVILVLSVADLIVTVAHLKTVGMIEANPIAHFILRNTQSALSLGCYKLLTVTICLLVVYRLRRFREGEFAAWSCAAILASLSIYWGLYAGRAHQPDALASIPDAANADRWVTLAE